MVSKSSMFSPLRLPLLHRYLLAQFVGAFILCLFIASSLFLIFDFLDHVGIFIREKSPIIQAGSYLLLKIPHIVYLMTPIAVLVATLVSVGRLSQLSEITAMRTCGVSLFWLVRPLLAAGMVIFLLLVIIGNTLVPWSSGKVEAIYNFSIRKKLEKGHYSRSNFWYRSRNQFSSIGFYDSQASTLNEFSLFEFNDTFQLQRRVDAARVTWHGPAVGWTMEDVVEITFNPSQKSLQLTTYDKLPLVISEKPSDFYKAQTSPETLSYGELEEYIKKLQEQGVPITEYLVQLASKISFPFTTVILVLIGFPFALTPTRSGTMTSSFVAGVSIGFGYHVVHAIGTSFGAAELIPVLPAAWAGNVLFASVGGYFMAGAEWR